MFDFEGSRGEFLRILAEMGEEPAFIARARAQEVALESLLMRCQVEREKLLLWPRRHFQALRDRLAGNWSRLYSLVSNVSNADSDWLFASLSDQLPPVEFEASSFLLTDRAALKTFLESAIRFNTAWSKFFDSDVLDDVNRRRDEYNRYYPMEKGCAFGNESIAADFRPLPMLDRSFLETQFPLLPVPSPENSGL